MSKYKVKDIGEKKVWEDFVKSRNPRSFLHSWNWGETNKLLGNEIFRLGFYSGIKLVGVCLLITQKARRGPHLLIPAGPLIDWNNDDLVTAFVEKIKILAKKQGAWFIRVRPELLDSVENRRLFENLGFVSAPMHLHAENTWVLGIEDDEEKILYGMRKNTRYLVRKSLKADLTVVESNDYKILAMLQEETVRRHKFTPFPAKLFEYQLKSFGADNQAKLYLVKKRKKVLAAAIIIFYGETAYYHHSGSVSDYRDIPFSYFLQWKVIKEAKKRGCKYYNFWGIAPTDNRKHRFWGVTVFKKGFGGERVDWLHARDLPVSVKYYATYMFELIRKRVRHL